MLTRIPGCTGFRGLDLEVDWHAFPRPGYKNPVQAGTSRHACVLHHPPNCHSCRQEVAFAIDGLRPSSFHHPTSLSVTSANQLVHPHDSRHPRLDSRSSFADTYTFIATFYAFNPLFTHRRRFSKRSYPQYHVHPCLILLILRLTTVHFRLRLTPPYRTEMNAVSRRWDKRIMA